MNQQTQPTAHPAFVEMIKEMEPIDAIALQQFRGRGSHICYRVKFVTGSTWREQAREYSLDQDVRHVPRALNNLERLGLIENRPMEHPLLKGFNPVDSKDDQHTDIERRYQSTFEAWKVTQSKETETALDIEKSGIYITALGNSFLSACMPKTNT